MPATRGSFFQRHWFLTALILAVLMSGAGVATCSRHPLSEVRDGLGLFSGRGGEQPQPPPPSDKLPDAPGPDNTIQTLPPLPAVPPQPPSPVKSESDPSKKPKERSR